jgi:hypothetical protein
MSARQAQGLLEKISTAQVKKQLRETTEAACKYGVSNSMCVPNTQVETESQCGAGSVLLSKSPLLTVSPPQIF